MIDKSGVGASRDAEFCSTYFQEIPPSVNLWPEELQKVYSQAWSCLNMFAEELQLYADASPLLEAFNKLNNLAYSEATFKSMLKTFENIQAISLELLLNGIYEFKHDGKKIGEEDNIQTVGECPLPPGENIKVLSLTYNNEQYIFIEHFIGETIETRGSIIGGLYFKYNKQNGVWERLDKDPKNGAELVDFLDKGEWKWNNNYFILTSDPWWFREEEIGGVFGIRVSAEQIPHKIQVSKTIARSIDKVLTGAYLQAIHEFDALEKLNMIITFVERFPKLKSINEAIGRHFQENGTLNHTDLINILIEHLTPILEPIIDNDKIRVQMVSIDNALSTEFTSKDDGTLKQSNMGWFKYVFIWDKVKNTHRYFLINCIGERYIADDLNNQTRYSIRGFIGNAGENECLIKNAFFISENMSTDPRTSGLLVLLKNQQLLDFLNEMSKNKYKDIDLIKSMWELIQSPTPSNILFQ